MDPIYLAFLLFAAAIVLAIMDIFLPSGGILLVLSAAAAIGSILFGFRSSNGMGMLMLTLVAASVPTFAYVAIRVWPHTPIGKRIILRTPKTEGHASTATSVMEAFVGQVLLADTSLMPSGQIKVGHRRFNAIAHSSWIEAGKHVKVIEIRDRSLIVRLTDEPLTEAVERRPAANLVAEEAPSLLDVPAEELGLDSLED
ncbi:MAG: NfeD family protein [Pirellulaceae bacterium]